MRDTLVKQFGKEYYDNEDYVITYVDWDLSNRTGHGALRILMKKTGHVYYLDIGTLGGIFDKVPKVRPGARDFSAGSMSTGSVLAVGLATKRTTSGRNIGRWH